jgi:hypothetical protein
MSYRTVESKVDRLNRLHIHFMRFVKIEHYNQLQIFYKQKQKYLTEKDVSKEDLNKIESIIFR